MPPRLIWLLVFIYTLCVTAQFNGLTCKPVHICEKCPEEALHQPFCQPFGNRRLMRCRDSTSSPPSPPPTTTTSPTPDDIESNSEEEEEPRPHYAKHPPSDPLDPPPLPDGDDNDDDGNTILAWESCGRVVKTERADFFEFATVNLLFVGVSIGVVIWRSRRMRALHARQLAARIGMVGRRR